MTIIGYDLVNIYNGLVVGRVNYEPPFKEGIYVRAVYANFVRPA